MSKCHVRELSNVFAALFQDAACTFPTLGAEFEKDLNRLQVLVSHRGIRVYLEDLPALGKHLDRCLADGQYKLSGLPLAKRYSGRVVIPKFLRGLYLLVFREDGLLREDYNVEAIFFLRQILLVAKKAVYPCSDRKILLEVEEFYDTDCQLPEPEKFWTASSPSDLQAPAPYRGFGRSQLLKDRIRKYDSRERVELSIFLGKLDCVSRILTTTLGFYDPKEWRFRHGPGAISERTGPTNKYYWSNWSDVLEMGYPIADCGFHNHCSWASRCEDGDGIGSTEPSSRLIAVPKTFKGPRLIAAEPSEHQWCQQNSWDYFCSRSRNSWIGRFVAFRDQSLNQALCTEGSETGSLATVDLSAASDRVTCHVVGQLFWRRPELLIALRSTRTRRVRQHLAPKVPEVVELRKFSTMGSACTFPVESLIFLSVALAAVAAKRGIELHSSRDLEELVGKVAVFGDDIVIPTDSRELFIRALEVLYFKVNEAKSFWTGKFRESCGVDSFNGVLVTPIYWRQAYDGGPESISSVVECRNNFYRKFLLNTAAYLESTLPRGIPQVATDSGVFGLATRFRPRYDGFPHRYNDSLQRVEVRVSTILSSQRRSPTNDDTAILQYFTEAPDPLNKWVHGVPQRPLLRIKKRWVPLELLSAQ
jgi:hypothetical protein